MQAKLQPCIPAQLYLTIALLLCVAACGQKQAASPPTGVTFKTHRSIGVVEAVDRGKGIVKINHEAIKDSMDAMTMDFHVRDTRLLDSIEPGDRVDFTLEDAANVVVVTEIKKR
ncbi:MAG: copper-binding protein [Pyrinomonadaceae bacterium]|nr:copper-binding protein [Pyrinomonadaceae bacterium]